MFGKRQQVTRLEGTGRFQLQVVGESNYQDSFRAICGRRKKAGEDMTVEATLVKENSPYDPNAVRVEIQGRTVGYVPRDVTRAVRAVMKGDSATCEARIRGGWARGGDEGSYGVTLDVKL